jgi:hypothetical protein
VVAFEHVTSWLKDLRAHADENVSIIRGFILAAGTNSARLIGGRSGGQ